MSHDVQSRRRVIQGLAAAALPLGALTSIVSGPTPSPRSRGRSKKTKPNEDPEPATTIRQAVVAMRDAKVPRTLCAIVLGVSPATIGRRLQSSPRSTRVPQMLNSLLRAALRIDEMAGWLIRRSMEMAKNSSTIVSM